MCRFMNKPLLFTLVFFIFISRAVGEHSTLTNVDLLSQTIDEAISKGLDQFELPSGAKIIIQQNKSENQLIHYITEQFTNVLFKKGFQIFTTTDTTREGFFLSFSVIQSAVQYTKILGRSFWKTNAIERKAKVDFLIQIINRKTNQLIWSGNLAHEKIDQIPVSFLEFVEQGGCLLKKPDRPKMSGVQKWIEPIIVFAGMGAMLYLFYSVRSQ